MVVVGLPHSLLSGPLAGRRDLGRVRETLLQFQGPQTGPSHLWLNAGSGGP